MQLLPDAVWHQPWLNAWQLDVLGLCEAESARIACEGHVSDHRSDLVEERVARNRERFRHVHRAKVVARPVVINPAAVREEARAAEHRLRGDLALLKTGGCRDHLQRRA